MGKLLYTNAIKNYSEGFMKALLEYSPKLISALVILIVGLYAIRFINRLAKKIMIKRSVKMYLFSCIKGVNVVKV